MNFMEFAEFCAVLFITTSHNIIHLSLAARRWLIGHVQPPSESSDAPEPNALCAAAATLARRNEKVSLPDVGASDAKFHLTRIADNRYRQ